MTDADTTEKKMINERGNRVLNKPDLSRNHLERDPALREARKAAFLAIFAECGVITVACAKSGVSRSLYYDWRDEDEQFDIACDDARQAAVDLAEFELRNRAVHGIEEPVTFKGEPVWRRDPMTGEVLLDDDFNPIPFTINRRSDRLLEVYMKANRQEYRDKGSLEVTGKDGGAIESSFEVRYVLPEGRTEDDYKVIEHEQDQRALEHVETANDGSEGETDYS